MSDYNPPDPLPPPLPIFNNLNWIIRPDVGAGGGGGVGTQGYQGPTGPFGGPPGPQGFQGRQGFQGLIGIQGYQGYGVQGFQGIVGPTGPGGGGGGGPSFSFQQFYGYTQVVSSSGTLTGTLISDSTGASNTTSLIRYTLNGNLQGEAGAEFTFIIADSTGNVSQSSVYTVATGGGLTMNIPYQIILTLGGNPPTQTNKYYNLLFQIGGEQLAGSTPVVGILFNTQSLAVGPAIPFNGSIIGLDLFFDFALSGTGTKNVYLMNFLKEVF